MSCDKAIFHRPDRCRKVQQYLAQWGDEIVVHILLMYAPETRPMEPVGWHLQEGMTRNQRCLKIEEWGDVMF